MATPHQHIAPYHWASYLINGDEGGLSVSDIEAADAFVNRVGLGGAVSVTSEDDEEHPGFMHGHRVGLLCPEARALGCDMACYTFLEG